MKPPRLISDLYSDLRDRHLLPLVLVLIGAIVAVPLLLGSDPEPVPPPPSEPATAAAEEIPTLPAVFASNPGLRDYRKRLQSLREKNPFAQHFKAPDAEGATVENVGEMPGASEPVGPTTSSEPGATETGSVDTGAATTDVSSADTSVDTVETTTEVEKFLIRHEVDLEIEGPNKDRKFENVRELETVPGKKTPLAVYVGVTPSENQAIFLLSSDIVRTDGDGSCSPDRSDCQLLTLGEGQQRKLDYAPNGGPPDRYVLKLHDVDRVVEKLD